MTAPIGAPLAHDAELRRTALVEFAAQSINDYFSFFIVTIAVSTLHLGEGVATQLLGLEGGAFMFALLASRLRLCQRSIKCA